MSHISVLLSSSAHYGMHTLRDLALCIRRSTSVADLHITYASTELLTYLLSNITIDYRANLLTIVCESNTSPTGNL